VTFLGVKHTLTPPTYFQGSRPHPQIYAHGLLHLFCIHCTSWRGTVVSRFCVGILTPVGLLNIRQSTANTISPSTSVLFVLVHFNCHFSRWIWDSRYQNHVSTLNVIWVKDDGAGDDKWCYKTCIAPVISSPPTYQHTACYRLDALPVAQLTASKYWIQFIFYYAPRAFLKYFTELYNVCYAKILHRHLVSANTSDLRPNFCISEATKYTLKQLHLCVDAAGWASGRAFRLLKSLVLLQHLE